MDTVLGMLPELTDGPIFVPPVENNPRAADPKVLAAKLGSRATPATSLAEALKLATNSLRASDRQETERSRAGFGEEPVLICGSLYLLAVLYDLYPEYLNEENA